MTIHEALQALLRRESLTADAAAAVMTSIMQGEATPAQIAGLLTALRMKGETVEEIAGFARIMREKAIRITPRCAPLVDTCGTGGAARKTFNVSTASALVVAAAGGFVAKHGNRAASSQSGSADVLEALGVHLLITPPQVQACIETVGIGFLFAQHFHPAMKYAAPVRRELGIRTLFNVLGPLTNPAGAPYQNMGVFDPERTETLARVLGMLGTQRAYVVHGLIGLDEWSTVGPTRVSELRDGQVTTYEVTPAELGVQEATLEELAGGNAQENARCIAAILHGQAGAKRDLVLLNAAAALVVSGIAGDLRDGMQRAACAIDSGAALEKLMALRAFTQEASLLVPVT